MKKEKLSFGIYHILLCISFFLVGCGKESNNYSLGIDGYVYVAEQVELPDGAMEFKIRNGYLYWMEEKGDCFDIHRVPVEAAFGEETSTWMLPQGEILLPVGDDVVSSGIYDVDESGNLYYICRGGFLVKRKPDGMEDYRKQLGDGKESVCSLVVGGGDRLFVATNTYIYVVSTGGNLEDTVSIGEYTRRDDLGDDIYLPAGLLKGTGKRIYCAIGWRFWEVAGEGKYQLKLLEDRKVGDIWHLL